MMRRAICSAAILLLPFVAQITSLLAPVPQDRRVEGGDGRLADTVLINGRILTVDAEDTVAEAVAVTNGKIAAVGSNVVVRRLIGKNTQVLDLHGRTATPGLIDTHAHFDMTRLLYDLDLSDPALKSIEDVVQRVKERAATLKPGEWVRGKGWEEGRLRERRHIAASDLDGVSPNNPVYLEHSSPRVAVVNSYALRLAGIGRETADPAAGFINRLTDGTPSGVLRQTAVDLVRDRLPARTSEEVRNGMLKAIEEFNKEGMTAVKHPMIDEPRWDQYRTLLAENRLTLHVAVLWRMDVTPDHAQTLDAADKLIARIARVTKAYRPTADSRLTSVGVKLLLDGSALARTAWLHEDYNRNFTDREVGQSGLALIPPETYRQLVRRFHDAGLHVGTHANGDRAIDLVVDTYAAALKANPVRGLRHAIIHCSLPSDHAIDVMADLQNKYDAGYPESQATFMWWLGDSLAGLYGRERSARFMPFRTYLAKGVRWTGGSDYAVTPFPARYGIWASVTRKARQGTYGTTPFGTAESIGVHDALRSYTIWAARQLFLEDRIGSLEPGKDADIAVWDRDPYGIPPDEIRDLKCEMTVFQGRIVYRAVGAAARSLPTAAS
jgi:predicted amidohydrolase YtcJ